MKPLAENEDKTQYLTNKRQLQYILGTRVQALRGAWGGDGAIVANLMERAGFLPTSSPMSLSGKIRNRGKHRASPLRGSKTMRVRAVITAARGNYRPQRPNR